MKWILPLFLFICHFGFGQGGINFVVEEQPGEHTLFSRTLQTHTGVLPLIRQNQIGTRQLHKDSSFLSISAIGEAGLRYRGTAQYRFGAGILLESSIKDKWAFRVGAIEGIGFSDSIYAPKTYFSSPLKNNTLYTDVRARIGYTPNSIFNFQVGLDHNFIGEGSRSLFLSDYGKPYPFGQIRAKFWRLEYTVLYQFFREQKNDTWFLKNGATHHISFNAAKWLNIGVFETVIFQPKDTALRRGYEVEYLNPVIFYRPQEYALGSSDNVLLGVSFSAHIKAHTLYGQFILDEFFLTEIKNKTGWWANKYGGQIGVKGNFDAHKAHWFYRLEYNAVRPFTYSHLNNGQNYGNQGMTLAHPYGSNFMELLGEVKVRKDRWSANLFMSYFLRGYDKDGSSYGGDIYVPYTFRKTNYDHHIGQGLGNNGFRMFLTVSYLISPKGNLNVFLEQQFRYDSAFGRYSYIPMIGIRSQLWNDRRNY
jgi:hypothetical protein